MDSESLLADHDTLTKYEGIHDPNFLKVSNRLVALAKESEVRVRQRWERWYALQGEPLLPFRGELLTSQVVFAYE